MLSRQERAVNPRQIVNVLFRQKFALFAERLFHPLEKGCAVDELDFALANGRLAVGDNPHIGQNPRIVEKLIGKGNNALQ